MVSLRLGEGGRRVAAACFSICLRFSSAAPDDEISMVEVVAGEGGRVGGGVRDSQTGREKKSQRVYRLRVANAHWSLTRTLREKK